jgi:translocation and assembly module TamB
VSRRKRIALYALGGGAGLALLLAAAAVLVVRSDWFFEKVRAKIVSTVEVATGGRVEVRAFRFDWRRLRAEVDDFVLHGTEPADKPPLFRAVKVAVGLKIVSLVRRDVDIEYLEVDRPAAYLIVAEDGRTNVPEPKVKQAPGKNAVETILDLAVGRFEIRGGNFEVAARGSVPFEAAGRNLQARLLYELGGPRYRGVLSVDPLEARYGRYGPAPASVALAVAIARNRVEVTEGSLRTGATSLAFRGALEDFANPRASAHYELRADLADARRILKAASFPSGAFTLAGDAVWSGGSNYKLTGALHAFRIEYRDGAARIGQVKADGALQATAGRAQLTDLRVTGVYSDQSASVPASLQVREIVFAGADVEARGVAVAAVGGTFRGGARLRDFNRVSVEGDLAGFEVRRLVALYSKDALPWDARLSGPVQLSGSLRAKQALQAKATLAVTPAPTGAPVQGSLAVAFDQASGSLDMGQSYLALPHSRLEMSGSVGRRLAVRLETRDLRDILPAVGAGDLPLRIDGGAIVFEGAVRGKADAPEIAGRFSTGAVAYDGVSIDSARGEVTASETRVAVRGLTVARGGARAQAEGSIALDRWKPTPQSALQATATVRDAPLADVLAIAGQKEAKATGVLGLSATLAGAYGAPEATAEVTILKGSVGEEPFDRIAAKVAYRDRRLEIQSAQATAGNKQIDLSGSFAHPQGAFDRGRVEFQLASNAMPLDQVRTLASARPGIRGNVILSAKGQLELLPARAGQDRIQIGDVHVEVRGRGLQLTNQPLGDFRLTADSQGGQLKARLASDFANSRIRGEGEWRLAGNYPGSAKVTFTRLDFGELSDWISPRTTARQTRVAGSAEGELQISGPALQPEQWKGSLSIPKIEIGPAPGSAPTANGAPLLLRNQGPIVATLNNQTIAIESARMVGRSTDVSLAGKVLLRQQRSPLDLRVNGRLDLGLLHEMNRDIFSSGLVVADATLRGGFAAPQVTGRMEVKNAAISIAEAPNGISRANGVILFTGDRATIQSLKGETGGGEVELSGFAGYGSGELVFRLHASAEAVRVRYPEGVSTVADAELDFTGTTSRSQLSGAITIVRTGFNPQSDFSSILAKSAEPVRTRSADTGFLGGLNFDIQIATSPDTTFQSSLTEGLQVEANLRLRGTASNPALQGRINITQGQLTFFGTRYTINQGSIAFYNPVKIEPVLNVDLETKARGVDVTLTVSGPINKMSLTPRSDPPLQFSEIVALLATGRTPTSDPSLLAQQSTSPQTWQQMGASTLLGQAIANPVAGRLQRFFGVSKLKIDPSLTGVENNPQARLTLEQQVTSDITFTYITNVTSSNPQVVRVEWAFSRQWSVVALREENGQFGLDFFYKRRFR